MKQGEFKGGVPKTPQDLMAIRIRSAFFNLRDYCVTPANLKLHDQFVSCVSPALAYSGSCPANRYYFDRHGTRVSTMFAYMHDAVTGFWDFCRIGQAVGLDDTITFLERFAKEGLGACQLVGDVATGFRLVFPEAQTEAPKE